MTRPLKRHVEMEQLFGADFLPISKKAPRPAPESDHEYYLKGTPFAVLPLTPLQRVRINAFLASGRRGEDWLSPAQRALLERVKEKRSELTGLEPPRDVQELWRYRAELEKRLGV